MTQSRSQGRVGIDNAYQGRQAVRVCFVHVSLGFHQRTHTRLVAILSGNKLGSTVRHKVVSVRVKDIGKQRKVKKIKREKTETQRGRKEMV